MDCLSVYKLLSLFTVLWTICIIGVISTDTLLTSGALSPEQNKRDERGTAGRPLSYPATFVLTSKPFYSHFPLAKAIKQVEEEKAKKARPKQRKLKKKYSRHQGRYMETGDENNEEEVNEVIEETTTKRNPMLAAARLKSLKTKLQLLRMRLQEEKKKATEMDKLDEDSMAGYYNAKMEGRRFGGRKTHRSEKENKMTGRRIDTKIVNGKSGKEKDTNKSRTKKHRISSSNSNPGISY